MNTFENLKFCDVFRIMEANNSLQLAQNSCEFWRETLTL